ncbi:Uncharacterised protein [Bartonella grahamii]|uniref:Uncharacterized protein n=1 Tax=Bartonella grahamii TaxID=33045 RepID=A0A336NEQ0_BARGR|nr:Uncharacterised protein [Bartonella grahamii]
MFEGGIKTVKVCLDVLGHVCSGSFFYCGDNDARYVFLLGGGGELGGKFFS